MKVQPYLFFGGRCEEAIEFYKQALGAEVLVLVRCKESPEPLPDHMMPPGYENKILHSALRIGETEILAADGPPAPTTFAGISLSLDAGTPDQAERLFKALSDSGRVQMPLGRMFFAERFGSVTDRFGVSWMVVANPAPDDAATA
jgi:PhnB protein